MASINKHRDKFQVRIRRKGLPTITKTFHRLADAKEWANLQEWQADRGELGPDRKELERITLSQLVTRYRKEIVPTKKGAEIETIILDAFLRHRICKKRLSDLTTADFASYRDERLKTITAKTLKRQLSPVSNMFEVARIDWQIPLRQNPLSSLSLKVIDNKRQRRLREGELDRLLEAGKKTRNPLILPIILFALETATRRGEILALRVRDIDLERQSATVRESKNGYSRTIPLSSAAVWLPELCCLFNRAMPDVTIEVEVGASHRLKDRVMSGALDVCLMHAPDDIPGTRRELLCHMETIWAAQPGIVQDNVIAIRDLPNYLIVTFGRESESFHILASAMRSIGEWPLPHISTNYAEMIINTIKRTPSVGTVLRDSIRRELISGDLVEIECELTLPAYQIYACYPLTRSGKFVRTFVDFTFNFYKNQM